MIKTKNISRHINFWSVASFVLILLIIIPNINVLINVFNKPNENWNHIKNYLLKDYIINSFILIIFSGFFTTIIGTSLAWIITVYDFPFKRFFKWALVLPLAIPPYIGAYTYNGILDYTGVVQTVLRNRLNIQVNPQHFDIMSIEGAVFIFTIFLFPYVYIVTRSFLEKQSASLIETSRLLGRNSFEIFFSVVLPISRGAIIGGVSLVILEILNDYGVVNYFGIPTFSTAIFKTWFAMGDIDSAVRLSAILMLIVFGTLIIERLLRWRKKFNYTTTKTRPISPKKINGINGIIAALYSLIIFSFGFIIPVLQIFSWSVLTYRKVLNGQFLDMTINSLSIALVTSSLIIIISLIIANYCRINEGFTSKIFSRIISFGYSIPGAVIAIGIIIFFIRLDKKLFWLYQIFGIDSKKLVLSTSIIILVFAYIVRFMTIGFNSVESGFNKIGSRFFEASRTLGMNVFETFYKVDFPMIKPAVIGGFVLVFIDIMKELPLTLILRPFNFNTLATKAYEYANDEMIHESSVASFLIILISVLSIYYFYKLEDKEESNVCKS